MGTMEGPGMGTMMLACGLFMLLVVVVLTLAIMALVKHLLRRDEKA